MGPPSVGRTETAKILADKIKYTYIDLKEFFRVNKVFTELE